MFLHLVSNGVEQTANRNCYTHNSSIETTLGLVVVRYTLFLNFITACIELVFALVVSQSK